MRTPVRVAVLLALVTATPSWAAAQTSQLQREICASSLNLPARVQACSEMLDTGRLDPEMRARTYRYRADAYGELGKFDLALGDYGRALDLVAFDAIVLHSRGVALGRLGRHADALKDLDRALLLRPEYGIAYESRARTQLDLALDAPPERRAALLAGALTDADRAIGLLGQEAEARLRVDRGRIKFYMGRIADAVADFTRALEVEPDSLQALSFRGAAYADAGDLDRAIVDFTRLLRLEPGARVVRMARGFGYFQTQQFALALADFDRVLTDAPGDLAAVYCRGAARVRTGDTAGQADIDAVRARRPDVAEAQASVCAVQ